jgi:hypothetical protein
MYDDQEGFKTERIVANGALNGGKPIRRLVGLAVLGGAAAGTLDIYDGAGVNAVDKRGGVTAPAAQWAWLPLSGGMQLATGKCFLNGFGANVLEACAVYEPVASAPA